MKIALLGKGKTGSKVQELSPTNVTIFDRTHTPTVPKLKEHDVVISFLPGEAFLELLPVLIEAQRPVICGSTGMSLPSNLETTLVERGLGWVYASNFSLGVVVLKQLIEKLSQVSTLFEQKEFFIHEVHHIQKRDAPSGTALSMQEWLAQDVQISSERTGDVVGFHKLTMKTSAEVIELSHEARDRSLFAQGALWAAQYVLKYPLSPGLHSFQKLVEDHLALK